MSLVIENIKLDKEEYYYWIDNSIVLSFEVKSIKSNKINSINCSYWCNFYWDGYKVKNYEEKIILEEEKNFNDWEIKYYTINIPIKLPNFKKDDFKSENYIRIFVDKKLSLSDVKELVNPKIILDNKMLWLDNFNNKKYKKDYYEKEIENLIVKTNEDEYKNILSDIKKLKKDISKIYSSKKAKPKEWKTIEYNEKKTKLETLINEKEILFELANQNDRVKLNELKNEYEKAYKDDNKDQIRLIISNIYELYKVKNIISYNNLVKLYLDKYYSNTKEFNYTKEIEDKHKGLKWEEWEYVNIKWFKRLILSRNKDLIHKDIYSELKNNFEFYMYDKLVNSKIYNFFYKYAILFIIFAYIQTFIFSIGNKYYGYLIWILFLIFTISLFLWLFLSKRAKVVIQKKIYSYILLSEEDISRNINSKFKSWKLVLSDIFDRFNIKIWSNIDYDFKLTLSLYFQWVNVDYTRKVPTTYYTEKVYEVLLFSEKWKWYFDFNKIEALQNNYNKLLDIMPSSTKKSKAKIFYKIKFKLKSSHLPDIKEDYNNLMIFNK